MLPEVKAISMQKLLHNYAENVDPLITRWLGHSEAVWASLGKEV